MSTDFINTFILLHSKSRKIPWYSSLYGIFQINVTVYHKSKNDCSHKLRYNGEHLETSSLIISYRIAVIANE